MNLRFTIKAIGVIRTPFAEPSDTPIQGAFDLGAEGTVEVFHKYADGLADVDGFTYLILLYRFHKAGPPKLMVKPYLSDEVKGVFATRSPARPNRIGHTIVKLLSRDGNLLRVAGVDMLDGTPLLDIKPYVPDFDVMADARCGWLDEVLRDRRAGRTK